MQGLCGALESIGAKIKFHRPFEFSPKAKSLLQMARAKGTRRRRPSVAPADAEHNLEEIFDAVAQQSVASAAAVTVSSENAGQSAAPAPLMEESEIVKQLQKHMEELESLGRREMQLLAKEYGVKANLKVSAACVDVFR